MTNTPKLTTWEQKEKAITHKLDLAQPTPKKKVGNNPILPHLENFEKLNRHLKQIS